jgi:hypothetical protein
VTQVAIQVATLAAIHRQMVATNNASTTIVQAVIGVVIIARERAVTTAAMYALILVTVASVA